VRLTVISINENADSLNRTGDLMSINVPNLDLKSFRCNRPSSYDIYECCREMLISSMIRMPADELLPKNVLDF
jgi:hypothetical protein